MAFLTEGDSGTAAFLTESDSDTAAFLTESDSGTAAFLMEIDCCKMGDPARRPEPGPDAAAGDAGRPSVAGRADAGSRRARSTRG